MDDLRLAAQSVALMIALALALAGCHGADGPPTAPPAEAPPPREAAGLPPADPALLPVSFEPPVFEPPAQDARAVITVTQVGTDNDKAEAIGQKFRYIKKQSDPVTIPIAFTIDKVVNKLRIEADPTEPGETVIVSPGPAAPVAAGQEQPSRDLAIQAFGNYVVRFIDNDAAAAVELHSFTLEVAQPAVESVTFNKLDGNTRSQIPSTANNRFVLDNQSGPPLKVEAVVTFDVAPIGAQFEVEIENRTSRSPGKVSAAVSPVEKVATIEFDVDERGEYEITVRERNGLIKPVTRVLEIRTQTVSAPITISALSETVGDTRYRSPFGSGQVELHSPSFDVDVAGRAVGRQFTVLAHDPTTGALLKPLAQGKAETADRTIRITVPATAVAPGTLAISARDTWTLEEVAPSGRMVVAVPASDQVARPDLTHYSNVRHGAPVAGLSVSAVQVIGRYLQLRGIAAPSGAVPGVSFLFPVFVQGDDSEFTRVADAEIKEFKAEGGAWVATLELPDLGVGRTGRVFALARTQSGHRFSAESLPFTLTPATLAPDPRHITIANTPKPSGGDPNLIQARVSSEGPPMTVLTNAPAVELSGTIVKEKDLQVVLLREGQAEPVARAVITTNTTPSATHDQWAATIAGLTPGEHVFQAALFQGGQEVVRTSPPIRVVVNQDAPAIAAVEPSNFGTAPRVSTLTIRFRGNPLQLDRARDANNYRLFPSTGDGLFRATGIAPQGDVNYDPVGNAVTLTYPQGEILPNVYRLEVVATPSTDGTLGLRDIYGNPLADQDGVVGRNDRRVLGDGRASAAAVAAEGAIPPGEDAPFVAYQEYTEPRTIPDGFQFSDKVETRVSRLYYYRDAHRVAEIVNRHAKSYNRVAVETRRRLAEKQRTTADKLALDRRQKELEAVELAKTSRALERRLETGQAELAQVRARAEQLRRQAATIESQIGAASVPLTEADLGRIDADLARLDQLRQAEADPRALADLDRQIVELRALRDRRVLSAPELADARGRLSAVQQELREATAAVQSLEASARQLPGDVQAARQAEATAGQEVQRLDILEDQARAEQFRLEVAAAHEDPDTYAPGRPDSDDPVEQVSVSVIGEGEIQLRGPLKGINEIRTMIHQIDAPVGQVQIGVHTVQINGERGDLLEEVSARIGVHIGQARFLTLQSAQMLRKAVVVVASRRAAAAAALCGPAATQAERDARYVDAFFGTDFVRELRAIDSEFLHPGNKVLSLHSMDSTSLAAALFLMALAKNDVREEILAEFHRMADAELPQAELNYIQSHGQLGPDHKCVLSCKHDEILTLLAPNARFQSLTGHFDGMVEGPDTLNPIQREFIRLAQIFKARLITELQLSQRVKERAIVEERLGNRIQELEEQKQRERVANEKLEKVRTTFQEEQRNVLVAFNEVSAEINRVRGENQSALSLISQLERQLTLINKDLVAISTTLLTRVSGAVKGSKEIKINVVPLNLSPRFAPELVNQNQVQGFAEMLVNQSKIDNLREEIDAIRGGLEGGESDIFELAERVYAVYKDLMEIERRMPKKPMDENGASDAEGVAPTPALGQSDSVLQFPTRLDGSKFGQFRYDMERDRLVPLGVSGQEELEREALNGAKAVLRAWITGTLAVRAQLDQFRYSERFQRRLDSADEFLAEIKDFDVSSDLLRSDLVRLGQAIQELEEPINLLEDQIDAIEAEFGVILSGLAEGDSNINGVFTRWNALKQRLLDSVQGTLLDRSNRLATVVDASFQRLIDANLQYEFAREAADEARKPIDHKKLLDMLIDEMEDKYIELLEGTRAHTAVVDGYIKGIASALDDDFKAQFYDPAFRQIRGEGRERRVQFGQIETTNVLTNNRAFAKVEPQAIMEFDLPKRDIVITEAMDGAKALVDEYGALLTDPTFLSATKLLSGQPTSSLAQGTLGGGASAVRNVLPGLPRSDDEEVLSQAGPGQREFGSALEALIPDPAIYKFETGTGFEIRPVIQPDGQAVVFHFNYMYTTNVREPVRPDEKHLGRVKRHFIDTDVQLSNYELREVSTYRVALRASRTSRGVPLFEDIPAVGVLFRPLPSDESSLQQNIILSQATIFPTLFDLMGLRFAPAVADLDTLRQRNEEFAVRGRYRDLSNHVYDISTSRVDDSLRIPPSERRSDLYRTQETIPGVHPNGYNGPGLNLRDSTLQDDYSPSQLYPREEYAPADSQSHRERLYGPDPGVETPLATPGPGTEGVPPGAVFVPPTSSFDPAAGLPLLPGEAIGGEFLPEVPGVPIDQGYGAVPDGGIAPDYGFGAGTGPPMTTEPHPMIAPPHGGAAGPAASRVVPGAAPAGAVAPRDQLRRASGAAPAPPAGAQPRRDPDVGRTSAIAVPPRGAPAPVARSAPVPDAAPQEPARPRGLLRRFGKRGE